MLVRISATDWVAGGHTLDDSVVVAGWLRELGVDLVDVSSGEGPSDLKVFINPSFVKVDGEVGNKKAYDPRAWGKLAEAGMAQRIVEASQRVDELDRTIDHLEQRDIGGRADVDARGAVDDAAEQQGQEGQGDEDRRGARAHRSAHHDPCEP